MAKKIKVSIRLKPTSSSAYGWQILPDSRSITRKSRAAADNNNRDNNNSRSASSDHPIYSFDAIFSPTSQTDDIFNDQISPILEKILPSGNDATIITCGSTGVGKTFTMLGSESDFGIVHLTGRYIFGMKNCSKVTISHIEIYNDEYRDLLCDNGRASLTRRDLTNPNDFMDAVDNSRRRASESISRNDRQSKSHSIFQITVQRSPSSFGDNYDDASVSTINLVELAGCEDVTRYNKGEYSRDSDGGISMNRSLGSLSRILSSLSSDETTETPASSQISRMLHPYVSAKKARIAIIACISPSVAYLEDTKLALQYLSSAVGAASGKTFKHQKEDEEASSEAAAAASNDDFGKSPNKYQILRSRLNAQLEEAEKLSSSQKYDHTISSNFQDERPSIPETKGTPPKRGHKKNKSCVFDFRTSQDNYDHCSSTNNDHVGNVSGSKRQQRHRKNNSCSINFGRSEESRQDATHFQFDNTEIISPPPLNPQRQHDQKPSGNDDEDNIEDQMKQNNCSDAESRRQRLQTEREKLTSWKLGRIIEEQEVHEWMHKYEDSKLHQAPPKTSIPSDADEVVVTSVTLKDDDNNNETDEEIRIRNEMTSSELSIKETEERLRAKLMKNKQRQKQRRQERRSFPLDEKENRINSLRGGLSGNEDDDRTTKDALMEEQQPQLGGSSEVGEIMQWQRKKPIDSRDDVDDNDKRREDITSTKRDSHSQNINDERLQVAAHANNNITFHDDDDCENTNDLFITTPNKTPNALTPAKTTATATTTLMRKNDDDQSSNSYEIVKYRERSKNSSNNKKKKKVHNIQMHTPDPINFSCSSPSSASSDLVYLLRKAEGLARHQDDNITVLTTDLAHYKQLSSSLKRELSDLDEEYSSEVKTLRLFIDEMERERTQLETVLKQEISSHKHKINALQDDLSHLHQTIATNKDNHNKEIKSLLLRLEESEDQNIHYKQQLEESSKLINNLKGDVHSQKEIVSLMNNHISELEEINKNQKMDHQSELQSLNSQLEAAQADQEDMEQHHQSIHKKDQIEITTLEKQLVNSERVIKSLKLNLTNFEDMATQSQADYESQLQSLRLKLLQTEKDKAIIEKQSNDKTKTMDSMQRNLTELQTAHAALNQRHEQFKQRSTQTTTTHEKTTQNLQDKLKKQSKELSSIQTQMQHLQSERDALSSQNAEMKDEISMLEDELIKTITFVQDGVGRQKDTITSLQSEVTRQRELMERSKMEHDRVVEEWKDRNRVLTVELEKKTEDVNLLSREMIRLTREEKTKGGGGGGGGCSSASMMTTKGVEKNESSRVNAPLITPSESSQVSLDGSSVKSSSWREYRNYLDFDI